MSEARKCDRCHVLYEIKPLVYNYITIGVRNIIGISGKSYDLCPNCVELLDKWLKNPDNYDPNDLIINLGDTDCADHSNGVTEKELELASKLNDAKIYIAQLKSELGYTMTKEETGLNSKLNEWGCPHNKCWDRLYFSKELNPFNVHDINDIYKCNFKNVYISGNCSRPNVSDMTPKDFCNLGCNFIKDDDDERVNNLYKEAEEISNNAGDTKEEESDL